MDIRLVRHSDSLEWLRLRMLLWPELSVNEHKKQMEGVYNIPCDYYAVFVADNRRNKLAGFLEASIDKYQDGTSQITRLFIEGYQIDSLFAKSDTVAQLHSAAESWGETNHCTRIEVETLLDSQAVSYYQCSGYAVQMTTITLFKHLTNNSR